MLPALPAETVMRARHVRLMVFDVDGVLTDGRLYYTDSGEELKAFSVLDGHGMKMLTEAGVAVAIITSRKSKLVQRRARDLGIEHLYQGVGAKREAMKRNSRNEKSRSRQEGGAGFRTAESGATRGPPLKHPLRIGRGEFKRNLRRAWSRSGQISGGISPPDPSR